MINFNNIFNTFANRATKFTGSSLAFIAAVFLIIFWLLSGPFFHWSEMHSLFINTATTIITFLMVFLIQSTQNRDNKALHIKLDELIRAIKQARDEVRGIEELSPEEIDKIKKQLS